MKNVFSIRDKAILIGLYLSKFDELGLNMMGFKGFIEAYNVLGYSIGFKPSSIKNYRDEFDPYFPNPRKGRHKRAIREYCRKFLEDFSFLDINIFTDLINSFVIKNYEIEKLVNKIDRNYSSESVAKRLITGRAAEEYFKSNYLAENQFKDYKLTDTTIMACGFDFKLSLDSDFYCIEVKGLNTKKGSISMTEKEFYIAEELKSKYCLFIVTNFIEKPEHQLIFDPMNSKLNFKKTERLVTQTNYSTSL